MSRHRAIRNRKWTTDDLSDEGYDDWDDYGNSASPMSPSMSAYMYNRQGATPTGRGQFTDYLDPVEPEAPQNTSDDDLVRKCMDEVFEVMGGRLNVPGTNEELKEKIRTCNYNSGAVIEALLASTNDAPKPASNTRRDSNGEMFDMDFGQPTTAKVDTSAQNSKKNGSSTKKVIVRSADDFEASVKQPTALGKNLSIQNESLPGGVIKAKPALDAVSVTQQSDIKPFDFKKPSPDDLVLEQQNRAFQKKKEETNKRRAKAQAKNGSKVTSINVPKGRKTKKDGEKVLSAREVRLNTSLEMKKQVQMTPAQRKSLLSRLQKSTDKPHINMVVIGHVDAGKSTMMGHLLCKLGLVSEKTMRKNERESKTLGKGSFSFAWVMDEHEQERERGVTIDVGVNTFETPERYVTLLDAPGHQDFVPNMISGAAQADCGILVVDSGSKDSYGGVKGQTREHAVLARSLGVSQLIVAVNKLDLLDWSETKFNDIKASMAPFLKRTGFSPKNTFFVPVSGLGGENLVEVSKHMPWYKGNCLIQQINKFRPGKIMLEKPFRFVISDVYKDSSGSNLNVTVGGKIESGFVARGNNLLVMPLGAICTVKGIKAKDKIVDYAKAGDNVDIGLQDIELSQLMIGHFLCDPAAPVPIVRRFKAKIMTFDLPEPILQGYNVMMYFQSINVPATIKRIFSILNKDGTVKKKKPRFIFEKCNAEVEIVLKKDVCLELYKEFSKLGRFTFRTRGQTIAAGIVEEKLKS